MNRLLLNFCLLKIKKVKFRVVISLIIFSLFSCVTVTKRTHRNGFYVEWAGKNKKPDTPNTKGLMRSYSHKKTNPVLIIFPEKDIEIKTPKEIKLKDKKMPYFFSSKKKESLSIPISQPKTPCENFAIKSEDSNQRKITILLGKIIFTLAAVIAFFVLLFLSYMIAAYISSDPGFLFPRPNYTVFFIGAIISFVIFIQILVYIWRY